MAQNAAPAGGERVVVSLTMAVTWLWVLWVNNWLFNAVEVLGIAICIYVQILYIIYIYKIYIYIYIIYIYIYISNIGFPAFRFVMCGYVVPSDVGDTQRADIDALFSTHAESKTG